MRPFGVIGVVLSMMSCSEPPLEEGPCIETYIDRSTAFSIDGTEVVRVVVDDRQIAVFADGVRVEFPRLQSITGFNGTLHDGAAQLRYQRLEDGVNLEVRNIDGVLLVEAGQVPGLGPGVPGTFAAANDPTSRCVRRDLRGSFAGVELRTAEPRQILEAGEEAVVQIDERSYLAGAPWAFTFDSGVYSGWAYVVAVQ